MKLPNFFDHAGLNDLRYSMQATEVGDFRANGPTRSITREELVALTTNGIDVTADQIEVLPDGTLTYKGLRVLVYIRDVADYGHGDQKPRFHFSSCRTLEDMQARNRFARYVVATRNDGIFQVNVISGGRAQSSLERLSVCQNCLARLTYGGFSFQLAKSDRLRRVARFSLTDFFDAYPRDVITQKPIHTADSQPLNDYTNDWSFVSEQTKRKRGMTCEDCGCKPAESRFVHVHHRDGVKYNNDPSNLQVLCIGCHAREHPHMISRPDYEEFMSRR
jgi:hypothetical protein